MMHNPETTKLCDLCGEIEQADSRIDDGACSSCLLTLEQTADNCACGRAPAWLDRANTELIGTKRAFGCRHCLAFGTGATDRQALQAWSELEIPPEGGPVKMAADTRAERALPCHRCGELPDIYHGVPSCTNYDGAPDAGGHDCNRAFESLDEWNHYQRNRGEV